MKINILTIPESGLSLRFSLSGDIVSGLVAEQGQFSFTLTIIDVAAEIKKTRQNIFLSGELETVIDTTCSRCLEPAHFPIKARFENVLLPETAPDKEERELQGEDLDVTYYVGEIIDLAPLIAEQIILQIPMKVLCQESCRGLCPRCGQNLNQSSCGCVMDYIDPRLAVLKKIKL